MPFISEYPTNSLSWWFDCTKVTLDPKPDLSFKYSLLSFLATVQALDVPFLHITWEDVQQSIGLGGTARIDEAYQTLQTSLAFKRVSKKSREQSSSTAIYQILLNEVVALRHPVVQHHPHIAPLQGVCWEMGSGDDKPWPVFVFERSVDGDLYSFISSPDGRSLDTRQRLGLVMNIGLAMEALHAADIIHGDVKPQNVLVFRDESEKCEAKLIDFGFSNTLSAISDDAHHRIRLPLSAPWNAPEHDRLLREWTSTQAMETDLYSFGMLCLWVLFEPYLSGSIAVCPPRDVNYNIKPGSSIWNLGTIKHTVQAFAQDLVDLDTTLKENERVILKEFFAKSLSLNPTERDISIHDLLDGLHCKRWLSPI
ncbi:kinase-like protein [Nemania abortiva]|nr:kinase-like protein [Nemania abortiva]